ncbi:DUF2290 domain-containing protein [Phenylobacterium sp.]|uniref:DUF2290 domain-containing protein n=1 Tax=Phenylobacterium sp. TaxID=1871053 RepID=UPI0025FB61C5|nr:DUF2290 domain-containing protein [Phenylobacterium sp.]
MSVAALARRITQFGFDLLGSEFALDARAHVAESLSSTRSALMWVRDHPDASLIIDDPARILDYLALLERKEYSFLMHDGAIVQVSYTFEGTDIDRHRLLYYPCPFSIDATLLDELEVSLSDLIREIYMEDLERSVALRSPVRFDYAPEAAADFHPASHITFNEQSCRIPVRAPMRFDQFMRFVLENFYPSILEDESISAAILNERDGECLSDHDRNRIHLTWRSA